MVNHPVFTSQIFLQVKNASNSDALHAALNTWNTVYSSHKSITFYRCNTRFKNLRQSTVHLTYSLYKRIIYNLFCLQQYATFLNKTPVKIMNFWHCQVWFRRNLMNFFNSSLFPGQAFSTVCLRSNIPIYLHLFISYYIFCSLYCIIGRK